MKNGRLAFYKSDVLVKLIDLQIDKNLQHNFILINDNSINAKRKVIKILDTETLCFYQVNLNDGFQLTDITMDKYSFLSNENNNSNSRKLMVYLDEYQCLMLVDKYLKSFSFEYLTAYSRTTKKKNLLIN